MRVRLLIEYDGTAYAGWQRQKNADTVQETIERAIVESIGQEVSIIGAGRTDAGVHAYGQVAHLDIETSVPAHKLSFVLNLVLPEDIRIRDSARVADDFHARKDAKLKHYRYTIYNAPHASAIARNTSTHVRQSLDAELMKSAAAYIKGTHDFSAFQAAGSNIVGTVRTIYSLEVTRIEENIYIDILGNGFLYNMVRIIAGTLINVGKGSTQVLEVPEIMASLDRSRAGATAPAKGLTMMAVYYETMVGAKKPIV